MKRLALVAAGFLMGGVIAMQVPSTAQQTTDAATERTITVSGSGVINAKPDEAVVSLGVQTEAANAQDAMDQNAARMTQVFEALKRLGVGDADLATTAVNLEPVWDSRGQSVVGFRAHNQIDVTLHDMGKIGAAIDAAISAGANLAGGITFRLSDQNQGVDDALARAVADAHAKAETMAGAADAALGQVVTIEESNVQGPQPLYDRVAYAAEDVATPVNPPTIETEAQVTVTWQLV